MSNTTEKRVTLDKNAIQGFSSVQLEKYLQPPYKTIVTKTLQIECLGNLTKECPKYEKHLKKMNKGHGTTKEAFTSSLFKKIIQLPLAKYDYMYLIKKELFNNKNINCKHAFFEYGNNCLRNDGLDIFKYNDSQKQVNRWASGQFSNDDYNLSKCYNNGLQDKKRELENPSFLQIPYNDILNAPKEKTISPYLIRYIEYITNHLFDSIATRSRAREKIISKIKRQPFCKFAPYTAYAFVVEHLFHNFFLPKWIKDQWH